MVAMYTLSGLGKRLAAPAAGRKKTGTAGAGRSVGGPYAATSASATGLGPGSEHVRTGWLVPSAPTSEASGRPTPPVGSSGSSGTYTRYRTVPRMLSSPLPRRVGGGASGGKVTVGRVVVLEPSSEPSSSAASTAAITLGSSPPDALITTVYPSAPDSPSPSGSPANGLVLP